MFYRDQQTTAAEDLSRLLSRNALVYEDHLYNVLGRDFRLSLPIEVSGPMQYCARFTSAKMGDGQKAGPLVVLHIEFNPAMGLFTVSGSYYREDGDKEPVFTSTPRSGFDDELLSDPVRLFDWLQHVTKGEPLSYAEEMAMAFEGLSTPAGNISEVALDVEGNAVGFRLEPEYRMPLDYYVSGTGFPGAAGGFSAKLGPEEWENFYATPVRDAVQRTVDNLYGVGEYVVDVDEEGYVYVTGLLPIPAQNLGSLSQPMGASTMNYPKDSNLRAPMESKMAESTWYAREMLRMAGVDGGERMSDRRLSEKYTGGAILIDPNKKKEKKKPPASFPVMVKTGDDKAAYDALVAKLQARKDAGEDIRDPERFANWLFLQKAGRNSRGGRKESRDIASAMRRLVGESTGGDGKLERVTGDNWLHLVPGAMYRIKYGSWSQKAKFVDWVDSETEKATESEDPEEVSLKFRDPGGEEWTAYFYKNSYVVGSSADSLYVQEL